MSVRWSWPSCVFLILGGLAALAPSNAPAEDWEGVDKAVIEKVAEEAGHPPAKPLIDVEHGDLLLFLFLLAGVIGGFVGGYTFRGLFPPRQRTQVIDASKR